MPLTADQLSTAYEAFFQVILRFCQSRLGDSQLAEEAAADVWYEAVRAADRYEDMGYPITAWLYRIAATKCIDRLRARARSVIFEDTMIDPRSIGFEDRVIAKVDALAAGQVLGYLRRTQREVLWLRFLEDKSIAQTAEILGVTEGAVKARQFRAVNQLARILGGEQVPYEVE